MTLPLLTSIRWLTLCSIKTRSANGSWTARSKSKGIKAYGEKQCVQWLFPLLAFHQGGEHSAFVRLHLAASSTVLQFGTSKLQFPIFVAALYRQGKWWQDMCCVWEGTVHIGQLKRWQKGRCMFTEQRFVCSSMVWNLQGLPRARLATWRTQEKCCILILEPDIIDFISRPWWSQQVQSIYMAWASIEHISSLNEQHQLGRKKRRVWTAIDQFILERRQANTHTYTSSSIIID